MIIKTAFFASFLASGAQALKIETSTSAYADLLAQMKVFTDY